MNKETFIALMKNEGWIYKVEDYSGCDRMMRTDGDTPPPINTNGNNGFWRGTFPEIGVFATDEQIAALDEKDFDAFFKKLTGHCWFADDWKKHFKGSEFLIPVVEKELEERRYMYMSGAWSKLKSIKSGFASLDDAIEYYEHFMKEHEEKLKKEHEQTNK